MKGRCYGLYYKDFKGQNELIADRVYDNYVVIINRCPSLMSEDVLLLRIDTLPWLIDKLQKIADEAGLNKN